MNTPSTNDADVRDARSLKSPRRTFRPLMILLLILAALSGGLYGYYCYLYPYGWSHSCDKQLYFALEQYARDHGGRFPAGQPTPEACLSLLHRKPYQINAHVLSGKTVDPDIAERVLAKGHLLGPNECSWHYVPGLRLSDDPKLALFWDKVPGLGHNGQRLGGGGFLVWFIDGNRQYISASEWDTFVAEQEALRQKQDKAD